ncbi:vWA domain-containing protein [Verrucomicrobiota bacterium sgz303538]
MSFLAPFFLFGVLAIGAPIIFHLIRRHTREIVPFSSLMFLQPTPPRVNRRSRLENLWLLLLRCIALALLALCFARPFFQKQADSATQPQNIQRTVVLLDTSASMRREDLWAKAQSRLETVIRQANPTDEVALLAFDRSVRTLIPFEEWQKIPLQERIRVATQRAASVSPSWSGTALGPAILTAVELLESAKTAESAPREVVVISDLQEGSRLDGLQGFAWPRNLRVTLEPVEAKSQQNATAHWQDAGASAQPDDKLILRVSNSAASTRDQFQLHRVREGGNTASATNATAYAPAGQSRTVRLPKAENEAGEQIVLEGDETDFDNTLYVVPPQKIRVPVLFVGNEAAENPGQSVYYLQRALDTMQGREVDLRIRKADDALAPTDLQQAQLLVLGEGATQATAEAAKQFAESGRIVLFPLTSAGSGNVLPPLLGSAAVPTTEATVRNYALFAQIDFQHPLFAPFADPRFSDFTKIHFWKYRRMDLAALPGARVLAHFDSKDPAIVQIPMEKGSVVLLASSWRPADSQLALSSKFVPLLTALLDQSAQLPSAKAQYFVGDEVVLPVQSQSPAVRKPDGTDEPVTNGRFTGTTTPGIYRVLPDGPRFVVNLSPEESRITPLAKEKLTSLGVPLAKEVSAVTNESEHTQVQAQAAELEKRQKLWRWLLAGAFVFLLLETWLAGRLARPAGTPALQS